MNETLTPPKDAVDPARYRAAVRRLDEANAADPRLGPEGVPVELAYARRLTERLLSLSPEASELLLLAARGQHVERWSIPRESYPPGRGSYLRWREALKRHHAQRTGEILAAVGYPPEAVERVRALIMKRALAEGDPEGQLLEDALCLVFLETQLAEVRTKLPEEKLRDVLRKTWLKMGAAGRHAAFDLDLPAELRAFLVSAVS
jgi:hypothetical protein